MKRFTILAAAAALLSACADNTVTSPADLSTASSVATAPGKNKLQCQAEAPATCTLEGKGAKGPATLDTRAGGYALVFLNDISNLSGLTLDEVQQLSFTYSGDEATPGAPRLSLAIDTNDDGNYDQYAFVSAYYCNDGAGLVDVINDPTCTIFVGSEEFENWDALVAAHPDWQIAVANQETGENYSFIIADEPGLWTISGVTLGKPGAQN
ncbi:MAG TPA: hypothetical protein VF042_14700 [Gemmatimonadaceae bacterium]